MGGTTPYTISWSFGDGTSGTGVSITHVYASAQSFTVTETAKDSSSPSQTATSSKTITVYSTPPPLTTSFTVLPSSPVVNSPVTFTATTVGGTAPYTISWNFGDGATATGATGTHTYTGAQSFTVTETVKDSSSPAKTATSSQTVNVQALIKPPTLTVPTNQTITLGLWVNFTITASDLTVGKVITLSASGLPTGATFDPSSGRFSWRPSSGQTGYYTIVFTATDNSAPPMSSAKPVGIQVDQAAPGGSGGGSGGSGGSNGGCVLCSIVPRMSTNMWLLVIGGLMGLVASLAIVTVKARANLERTKRRMRQLNR